MPDQPADTSSENKNKTMEVKSRTSIRFLKAAVTCEDRRLCVDGLEKRCRRREPKEIDMSQTVQK